MPVSSVPVTGSPPRMRGKAVLSFPAWLPWRITPRVCGEKGVYALLYTGLWGSPPRMRGKVLAEGISSPVRQDHPRVCGEKISGQRKRTITPGSPLRMRGKGRTSGWAPAPPRITPAYAGKSHLSSRSASTSWDHPRVCGEKICDGFGFRRALGSPPRMRGKVTKIVVAKVFFRITPAYAGKSCKTVSAVYSSSWITPAYAGKSIIEAISRAWNGDHPRVCGEKMKCLKLSHRIRGSPPRMRGKGTMAKSDGTSEGITPAYAGKRYRE